VRISLVHIVHDATVSYSHGLASIASLLNQDAAVSLTLEVIREEDLERNVETILRYEPDVVMVSSMSNQWAHASRIASRLRVEARHVRTVVGGSHVIASPSSARESDFDFAVNGEGETIIEALTATLKRATLRTADCQVIDSPLVDDLDKLPLPLLEIFPVADILAYPSVMFSRGCPYKCNYCMSRLGGLGGRVRWKSPKRAIREARQLVGLAHATELYVDDDTLLKNPTWLEAFCRDYRTSGLPPFYCNARPETVREKVCRNLVDAGCIGIGIGIESGSERIRRDVLGRRMSDRQIVDAFRTVHTLGMKTWSFNMVGIPGETIDDLMSTIELNEQVQTDFVRVSVYTPYPGTPMHPLESLPYARGYIHPDAVLSEEKTKIYREWLSRLERDGRLWFTRSEGALLPRADSGSGTTDEPAVD
jgi:radical SAM superfamily enzyme YgiQ (UPF0313 family)